MCRTSGLINGKQEHSIMRGMSQEAGTFRAKGLLIQNMWPNPSTGVGANDVEKTVLS